MSVRPVSVTPLVTEAARLICEQKGEDFGKLTDDALPEVVGLAFGGLVARELPVNFIFDAAHGDEGGDHTSPTARFHWVTRVKDEMNARAGWTYIEQ